MAIVCCELNIKTTLFCFTLIDLCSLSPTVVHEIDLMTHQVEAPSIAYGSEDTS